MKLRKVQKKKFRKKVQAVAPEISSGDRKKIEIKGVIYIALGLLLFFSFFFKNSVGAFGGFIKSFIFGMFGSPAYFTPFIAIFFGWSLLFKKNLDLLNRRFWHTMLLLSLLSALFQTGYYEEQVFDNLSLMESIGRFLSDGKIGNGGGIIGGLISMPFLRLFQTLGTIIIILATAIVEIIVLTEVSMEDLSKKLLEGVKKVLRYVIYLIHNIKTRNKVKEIVEFNFKEELELRDKEEKRANRQKSRIYSIIKNVNKSLSKRIYERTQENSEKNFKKLPINFSKVTKKIGKKENIQTDKTNDQKLEKVSLEKKRDYDKIATHEDVIDINIKNEEDGAYRLPKTNILNASYPTSNNREAGRRAIDNAKKLEETLLSFGVEAKVVNCSNGPAVTRYELAPSPGVKVSKIVSLTDDISLNLATSGIRIEAPIPGKAAIGIEVPNSEVQAVSLREVIDSKEFKSHPSKMVFAVGKDISGQCIVADIAKMPHMLIAGATGSGKSVCINTIIMSILYKAKPSEVRLVMIDPKVVELGIYNGIPHLLIPVVTDPKKAASALNWAVQEMVTRYKLFADKGVRDIQGYNTVIGKEDPKAKLPQVLIIIDELADLMMVAPNDVEDAICRLAQMARAAGMHLVIATQRPSVDVITGIIKANIPSRVAFAVSSQVDSRTILDMAGAEKLLGKGDMLFYPIGEHKPVRVKGAFVSDREVEDVVNFVKAQEETKYDEDIIEGINKGTIKPETSSGDDDEILPQAIELVVDSGQASVSLIQRKFKVGYARAARIIDQMEERGIVGAFEGSKPRQVLMKRDELMAMKLASEE